MEILIQVLLILFYVAIIYLILYLFQKFVVGMDQKLVNIIIFLLAMFLVIAALTGHNLIFWR